MNEIRVVPLACSRCGADLLGRSVDRLAFCIPCGAAYRVDTPTIEAIRVVTIEDDPTSEGSLLHLPFWKIDDLLVPAFISPRPLTLARIASSISETRSTHEMMKSPVPLGARLAPENLAPIVGMLKNRAVENDEAQRSGSGLLFSIPARAQDRRFRLPGTDFALYPQDVIDSDGLLRFSRDGVGVGT